MPLLSALFVLGAVAICGLPPLNGFAGEFLIYLGAFRGHMESGNVYAVPSAVVVGALALIGGLAAVTFAKVIGIVFLGSPRTADAVNAHAPGLGLTGPMAVLGLLCVAVGLGSPRIAGVLAPVAAGIAKLSPDRVVPATAEVAPALSSVVTVSGLLLVLVAALYGLRALLLSKREVASSTTWGCGYLGGTPRIQYTGSSFVEPLGTFFAGVFRERRTIVPSTGLFPAPGSYFSEMPDVATELVYRPAFRGVGRVADLMRWIQNGQTHLYILYVALTLIVLLVWYLGLVMPT
jgi:hydrogenase-4 component B